MIKKIYLILSIFLLFKLSIIANLKNNYFLNDSIFTKKSNYIYLMPTSSFGDLYWDLENYWLDIGYEKNVKNKFLLSLKFSSIIKSNRTTIGLLSNINSIKTTGYNFNIEFKKIFYKKMYWSLNFSYQYTNTLRDGIYDTNTFSFVSQENYNVIRNVYCFYPKYGFHFVNKYLIYSDIGIGIGLRYINSCSQNKDIVNVNSGYETITNKEFDNGSTYAPKINFQIKIGYNF